MTNSADHQSAFETSLASTTPKETSASLLLGELLPVLFRLKDSAGYDPTTVSLPQRVRDTTSYALILLSELQYAISSLESFSKQEESSLDQSENDEYERLYQMTEWPTQKNEIVDRLAAAEGAGWYKVFEPCQKS